MFFIVRIMFARKKRKCHLNLKNKNEETYIADGGVEIFLSLKSNYSNFSSICLWLLEFQDLLQQRIDVFTWIDN